MCFVSILWLVCYAAGSTQGISYSLLALLWYSVVPFNSRSPLIFQAQFCAWLTFDRFKLCHCSASSIWKRLTPCIVVSHFSIPKNFNSRLKLQFIRETNFIWLTVIAGFFLCYPFFSIHLSNFYYLGFLALLKILIYFWDSFGLF